MTHPRFRIPLVAAGLMLSAAPAYAQAGRTVSFSKDIIPIFQKKCQLCHGVDSRGGLKLDSYDNVMLGGTKGQDVIPGNPAGSRLIQLVEARQMPPTGMKLTQIEVFMLRTWIQAGAKELLRSDAELLAERARAAGCEVELEIGAELWHDYQVHAGMMREADEALARMGAWLAARLHSS